MCSTASLLKDVLSKRAKGEKEERGENGNGKNGRRREGGPRRVAL